MKIRFGFRRTLILLVAALVVAGLLNLRPLLLDFDTVPVHLSFESRADSPGARLDTLMLERLGELGGVRSFDAALAAGPRSFSLTHPLWLDRCEVRQGDFGKFSQWRPFNPNLPITAPSQPPDWRHYSESAGHAISGRLSAPASGLTWYDAYAYCRGAGGRLPSPDEWIAAAAGKEQRLYPWGEEFNPDPWPYLDPILNAAQACDAHPDTATPEGFLAMAWGVSEWADFLGGSGSLEQGAAPVMGGNAWNRPRDLYAVSYLHRQAPRDFRSPYLGFRCVYDTQPRQTPWRTVPDVIPLQPGDYSVGIPEDARIPSLVALLPSDKRGLIQRIMGSNEEGAELDLYVSVAEVSRREYAVFLRDPFVKLGLYAEDSQPKGHDHVPLDWEEQLLEPDLPVTNIDWWSAYAYAAWAGGRLPTAEEWAAISSGQGARLYPWGNDYAIANAVTGEQRLGGPVAVNEAGADLTPEGVMHLAGNVSEWTRSVSSVSGSYAIIVKGGNFLLQGKETGRMDHASHVLPQYRSPTLGFRVVFDRAR